MANLNRDQEKAVSERPWQVVYAPGDRKCSVCKTPRHAEDCDRYEELPRLILKCGEGLRLALLTFTCTKFQTAFALNISLS